MTTGNRALTVNHVGIYRELFDIGKLLFMFLWLLCCNIGSVFCVSASSRTSLAVSGGEDDVAYVWNVTNGDLLFTCSGN